MHCGTGSQCRTTAPRVHHQPRAGRRERCEKGWRFETEQGFENKAVVCSQHSLQSLQQPAAAAQQSLHCRPHTPACPRPAHTRMEPVSPRSAEPYSRAALYVSSSSTASRTLYKGGGGRGSKQWQGSTWFPRRYQQCCRQCPTAERLGRPARCKPFAHKAACCSHVAAAVAALVASADTQSFWVL